MALDAGANAVGGPEMIKQVENGEADYDVYITTPTMIDSLKHLSRVLKSKMPVEKKGMLLGLNSCA